MRRLIFMFTVSFLLLFAFTTVASASVYVRGYYRSDGTYVAPHYRSDPDGYFWNNYSSYGNINPYTGKIGTRWPSYYDYTPIYYYTPSYYNYYDYDYNYGYDGW